MNSACFKRRTRLTVRADYRYVFERPLKSRDRYFTVLARHSALGFPRLGLAISRKAAKFAVDRNRIKRVVRESFRHHQPILGSIDIVVLGQPKLTEHSNQILFASLQRHWARLVKKQCAAF